MEKKSLYIYKLDEQGNKVKFPNSDMPAKLGEYTYSAQRMAGTPTLTGTLDYPVCLDDEWPGEEFVEFRGEKYYIDQIPTSSKDNKSIMYKHELQFVSERIVLENVYFMDVVTSDADTYHSNSTSVKFMGDIHEFVSRLNASMTKSGIGYSVVIDDDITSDSKLVSLDSVYLADALQSIYTIYDLPYYFVGKVCHIGYTENVIPTPFEYRKGLVSIKKTNANYKIVNRVAGVGSTDNIPFYYPNDTQYGEIGFNTSRFDKSVVRNVDYRLLKSNIPNFLTKTFTWNIKNVSITWGERTGRIPFKEGEHIGKFISTCRLFASKGDSFTLLPKLTVSDGEYAGINHVVYVDGVALPHSNDRYNINVELSGHTYSIKIEWEVTIAEASGAGRSVSDVSEIQGSESRKGWIYEDLGNSKFVKSSDIGIYLRDEALLSTGDTISFTKDKYIEPSRALMPSIYRQSGGAERFYNAINNTYKIPGTNDYYSFKNIYSAKNVKEIKVDFSHIKPTIEGVVNASGQLFGEIAGIAFDTNDSDELGTGSGKNVFDGTDEYVHSYFYVKLHIYNGDYGFNLFEQGLEGGTAVINMTTGNCAACEFEIGVTYKDDRKRAYNPVLVDSTGALIPGDFEQKVTSNTSQYVERQQDTSRNEVWIAVKKDNKSFGVVMPNATNNYKPSIGDKFVITGIKMPKPIILAAEKRLEEALIKYMSENNDEKFTFSINFSRVFLADNSHLSDVLNENARIYIKYNSREYFMYVSSFTCRADKNCLYDISVELTDKLSANVSALRSTITSIAGDIIGEKLSNTSTSDIVAKSSRHFLSKTRSDRTEHSLGIGEDLTVDGNATVAKDLTVMEILRALIKIETASLNVSGNSKTGTLDVAGKATAHDVEVANQVTSLNAVIRALATIHNLTVENTADIMHGIIRQYLSSDKFVSGFLGEGFKVWKDASGLWHGELDMLTVRKTFTVFELVVQKVVHQGGMVIRSAAGGKITKVTDGGSYWRCEHDSTDDFVKDDQVLCQVFTGLKMKRYWRLVTSAGAGYFNLSKTDCEAGSATPEVDDEVAVLGNRTNAARQSAQIDCAVGANAPYRDDYAGINSYSLTGKLVTRTGNLSGIVDPDFGALSGFGLYSLNAYLKGMLRLTSGKTVETAIGEARSGAISAAASDAQAKANAAKAAAISAAASDAQAKATAAETNAKTHAQAILDALQIGGRNLIPGSGQLRINSGKSLGSNYIPGQQYTISIERSVNISPGTQKGALMMLYCSDVSPYPLRVYIPISETRQVATFTYPQAGKGNLALCATEAWTGTTDVTKLKIEKGAKATDWTPAPEDVEAGIDLEIKKVRTDFDVREGQISSKVAEVTAKTQQAVSAAETAASEAGKAKSSADTAAAKLITVTEKESNINQTAGQIATGVAEVTRQAGIASNAANNANTALQTVSTKQTQINQVAADIDLKASRAEQAASRAEEAEARVNIAADGVVINAAKQAAQQAVDGVQIGGRNYIILSKLESWIAATSVPVITDTDVNVMLKADGTTNQQLVIRVKDYFPDAGAYYTVSGYMTLGGHPIKNADFIVKRANYALGTDNFFVDDTTGYFECTHKYNGSDPWLLNAKLTAATGTPVKISKFKFEKGTKASDWTPAPEDVETDATAKADAAKQSAISDAAAKYPTKTEYSAQLAVLNSSISSKVSQTDFTALSTRMSTAEEKITPASIISTVSSTVESAKTAAINAAASDAKAKADAAKSGAISAAASDAQAKADAAKQSAISTAANDATAKANAAEANAKAHANNTFTPITTYNTKVAQLENLISLKAESSTVNGLTTRMAAAEEKITPGAINMVVKEQITTAVGNVQVGGRNYVILSKLESWIAATSVPVITDTDVNVMLKIDGTTNQQLIIRVKGYVPDAGAYYTVSGYMTLGGRPIKNADFIVKRANYALGTDNFFVDDASGYFECTHKYNGSDPWLLNAKLTAATGTPVKISKFKFEKGTKATDWSPAPEDVQADIALRPTKEEIKAGISITTGGINVFGKEISLAGKVTFASLDASTQATINGKATTASLTALQNRLGAMAYQNMVSLAKLDNTIVQGGYIKTSLIEARSITADKLDVGSVQAAIVTADAVNALNIIAKKIQSVQGTFDRIEGASGQDSMLLTSSLIRFKNSHTNVIIGADTMPASAGGIMVTPVRIHVERAMPSYHMGANAGLYLSVTGAKPYDDFVESGNHALFIPKGGICGMRLRARRIGANTTLSVMDSIVFVIKTGVTVTLPGSGVEDGQIYFIRNHCGGTCRIAGNNIRAWNDGGVGNSFEVNRSNMAILMYDAHNNSWTANWTGNW